MSVEAALPSQSWTYSGLIITMIVPSLNGCNLDCPFCFIDQRGESSLESKLRPRDYGKFIYDVALGSGCACVCIQGHEPLMPESFSYTRSILSTCKALAIPSSLVTNGTYLADWIDELRVLAPERVSVSLDAATEEVHDRQRRKPNAFASTVHGLKRAVTVLPSTTELVVTSVLIPKRRAQLENMPELLRDIGVKRWVVTALQKIEEGSRSGPVGKPETILADLRVLNERAQLSGIDFKVDDEFDLLSRTSRLDGSTNGLESLRIRRLNNPAGVYRLVPDGRCSKGTSILTALTDQTARWEPDTDNAATFLANL